MGKQNYLIYYKQRWEKYKDLTKIQVVKSGDNINVYVNGSPYRYNRKYSPIFIATPSSYQSLFKLPKSMQTLVLDIMDNNPPDIKNNIYTVSELADTKKQVDDIVSSGLGLELDGMIMINPFTIRSGTADHFKILCGLYKLFRKDDMIATHECTPAQKQAYIDKWIGRKHEKPFAK